MTTAFIETERLALRALRPDDANETYLGWLNDPEVLRFRHTKAFPSGMESLRAFVDGANARGDLLLAICSKDDGRHIGNIALTEILWPNRCAALGLMIGARDVWGTGLGKEAIRAVCRHGFLNMGLNRIWAESPNPAFNGSVRSLGWTREGVKRQAFLLDGALIDLECWAILASEFAAVDSERRP